MSSPRAIRICDRSVHADLILYGARRHRRRLSASYSSSFGRDCWQASCEDADLDSDRHLYSRILRTLPPRQAMPGIDLNCVRICVVRWSAFSSVSSPV